jgi:hypothetical protein
MMDFFALFSTFSEGGICPQELPREGISVVEGHNEEHKNIWGAFVPRVRGIFKGQWGSMGGICPPWLRHWFREYTNSSFIIYFITKNI